MPTITPSVDLMFPKANRKAFSTECLLQHTRPAARILNPRQGCFTWRMTFVMSAGSDWKNGSPTVTLPRSFSCSSRGRVT